MSDDLDAEQYELKDPLAPGKPVPEGFQDPSGAYPRASRTGRADTQPRAQGFDDEKRVGSGRIGPRAGSTKARRTATLGRSSSKSNPRYTYNKVLETPSGHLVEYDDSPGYERIRIRHRTGSEIELHANGDLETRSMGSRYSLTLGDEEVVVRGVVKIVVESSAEIRVQGDAVLEVQGDFNQVIGGNHNLEVLGDQHTKVHGNQTRETVGGLLETTRGNVFKRNLSNSIERTVGDHNLEVGGTIRHTAEGSYRLRAYGQLKASFAGGLLTLNGLDADGVAGEGQVVSTQVFFQEAHGGFAFIQEEMHATAVFANSADVDGSVRADIVHAPTFEGTAKRAQWATTAGSAPTGASTPVTASPDSPEALEGPEAAPSSDQTVEPVIETSDPFILALDRTPINGYVARPLSTNEATLKLRNSALLFDSTFLRELVETGAITDKVLESFTRSVERKLTKSIKAGKALKVVSIPEGYRLNGSVGRSTPVSPNFRLSHLLGDAKLKAQAGLSKLQIARNLQLLAYNILEPLFEKYAGEFSVSEGFYEIWPTEPDPQGVAIAQSVGQCCGIQFRGGTKGRYFEVASWIKANLIFDQLILSYTSYDPLGVNEPTILLIVRDTGNRQLLFTEYNHRVVDSSIMDLADDDA